MSENKDQASTPKAPAVSTSSSIHDTIKDTVASVRSFVGEYTGEFGQYYDLAKNEYKEFNRYGPTYLTNFKKDYVLNQDPSVRNLAHSGFTLLFLVASLKAKRGVLRTARDTGIWYYAYGALFNPEAVNPFHSQ